ncbi:MULTISPECIES: ANTAR domain-containing protein [unclassified Streptomyces]|uniref:ANTAR domain-containing protein n=1 Tax=unclassified Streptomyces TaxID=2593676 RepID=UPI0035DE99CE
MTSREPVTVLSANDWARVVCLTGSLNAEACPRLERALGRHVREAARKGQRLILDLAAVPTVSAAARRTLQQATAHLTKTPVLVVAAAPAVREVLERCPLAGVRLRDTLADALTALAPLPPSLSTGPGMPAEDELRPAAETKEDDLQSEIFGMRAKARSSALISIAQGILIARYGLPGPAAAFDMLRAASQHLNVPVRVLASAAVAAPPPMADAAWFPGRRGHAPHPDALFLRDRDVNAKDRSRVLTAILTEAVALSDADAAEIHLTDPAHGNALLLEQHHNLDAAYRDQTALVTGPPAVCAQAQQRLAPITVDDVAADASLANHAIGRALLTAHTRTLTSVPLVTADRHCTGVLSLHWKTPAVRLTAGQQQLLNTLANETAAWCSWYRRTIVLDALEYLHQNHPPVSA